MGLKEGLSKVAGWFQPAYNKIDKWDVPWLRDACRGIWGILDGSAKKYIYDLVMYVYKNYGEKKAKDMLDHILNVLHLNND